MNDDLEFSLVRGGPFYRVRRALGLVPEKGLGLAKRFLVIIAVAWLPVVIAAIIEGRAFEGSVADPLLRHYGVHARFLLAIPLLLLAEVMVEKVVPRIIRQFVSTGLVDDSNRPSFVKVLRDSEKLRDSKVAGILILAIVAAVVALGLSQADPDEMSWAGGEHGLGFAGQWYTFVSRPFFVMMLGMWTWRMVVGWYLQSQLGKVDLRLVPTHPDRMGGLGFLEYLSLPIAPVVTAISVVLAGRWAHEVQFHAVHIKELQPVMIAYVIVVALVFVGPILLVSRSLGRFKRISLIQYGGLIGHEGRMIHKKWIDRQKPDDEAILNSPEIGPMADGISLYNAVSSMQPVVIGKRSVIPIVAAAVLPLVPVMAIEIPIAEILKKLLKTLI